MCFHNSYIVNNNKEEEEDNEERKGMKPLTATVLKDQPHKRFLLTLFSQATNTTIQTQRKKEMNGLTFASRIQLSRHKAMSLHFCHVCFCNVCGFH